MARRTRAIVGVEAAVEADLQLNAGLFHSGQRMVDDDEVVIDGLLAEDVLACGSRFHDDLGMGVGSRADHDGIHGRAVDDHAVVFDRIVDAKLVGGALGGILVDVCDEQAACIGNTGCDMLGMQAPDSPGSDQS